jgi:hypothetical protein
MPQDNITYPHSRNLRAVKVNLALMRFYRRTREVEVLRQELQACEASYYHALADKLAPWFAHSTPTPDPALVPYAEAPSEAFTTHLRHMQEMMRHMYVALARHYHPDHQGQEHTPMMQRVNEAYAERELGTLMMLYQETLPLTSSIRISDEDMQHYLERIRQLSAQVEEEYQQLRQSDLYALKERLLRARLEGKNLIEEVAESLKQRYSATSR